MEQYRKDEEQRSDTFPRDKVQEVIEIFIITICVSIILGCIMNLIQAIK